MDTMEQVYMDAARACGLKPGDRVRVTRKAESREAGWCNDWAKDMDEWVGKTGTIHGGHNVGVSFGIIVDFPGVFYAFPYFVLKKVADKSVGELKEGDYVRVLRGWEYDERGVNVCPPSERWLSKTIGKVGRIKRAGASYCDVEFPAPINDWFRYPWFVLEPAEKPEPEFTPFQKVLVRDSKNENWRCDFYSYMDNAGIVHCTGKGGWWQYCIPYEGNEALVGTTNDPEKG